MLTRVKKKLLKRTTLFILAMLMFMVAMIVTSVVVYANSYYTLRINYKFKDGTPAHDSYVATYLAGDDVNITVTNPNITGFAPMTSTEGGESALTTTFTYDDLDANHTVDVYYIAGLTHYRAIYYKQNIYDDLYTRDNTMPSNKTDRYGLTGSNPTDLEDEQFDGFTNLFHEPDAIAADGSTVFRVYYDRNYYSVNFDLDEGGYGVDTVYAKYQSVYHISEPKRPGYTFLGWIRTNKDSSEGTYGTDWKYIDENGNEIAEADVNSHLITNMHEGTVALGNTYYKAVWQPKTTKYSIVYWVQNPDSTATLEQMGQQTTTEDLRTLVTSNYTVVTAKDFDNVPSNTEVSYEDIINKYDFFYQYDSKTGKKSTKYRDISSPSEFPSANDPNQSALSAAQIDELNGQGRFFELNTFLTKKNFKDDLRPDMRGEEVLPTKTIRGDGTTRINVYYDRKDFTLKFFYAREKIVNGEPSGLISLTNSTKGFSKSDYYGSNYLRALAMEDDKDNAWANNIADSLPHLQTKYTDPNSPDYIPNLEELSVDYTYAKKSSKGGAEAGDTYRYYYYQVSAKYGASLENKWLVDPVTSVHRKGKGAAEMCISGSWAVENKTKFHDTHTSVNNFTVKGFYEKLGKELMFNESITSDYTELHYLISWTNTGGSGWNYGINRVLHFKYENYTELLPKEVDICENDPTNGPAQVKSSGGYKNVRSFTFTDIKSGETVTKWYGLKDDQIVNTIDSGDQYDRNKSLETRNLNVRLNQTSSEITGFQIENYRVYKNEDVDGDGDIDNNDKKYNGQIVLNDDNIEIDWSEDTDNDRHATIRFFYRRLVYTLKFRNGNNIDREFDQSEDNGVAYGVSLNKKYASGDHAGEYIYKYTPEYPNEDLKDYYEFDGWYYTPYYYREVDFDTQTMPADDLTFYAKWVPKKIKVSFYDTYNEYYHDVKANSTSRRIKCIKNPDYVPQSSEAQSSEAQSSEAQSSEAQSSESIEKWIDGDIIAEYGSYVPYGNIPADTDNNDERPVLEPPAEGAQFAGWYYLRDNVPVRFEPENVPVTALNAEAADSDDAKLRLYAEWVTKDVAKYKVQYVEAYEKDENGDPIGDLVEVASPTTGRAFVYKTKTFDAKCGDDLNSSHEWSSEGNNWWPIVNSHSFVVKANEQGKIYAPNEYTFEYIQKHSVYYKVQYLDATSRTPLEEEVILTSNKASVEADAPFIHGYTATAGTKTQVLAASTKSDPDEARAEELANNVITFYYNENNTEYLYDVKYWKQNIDETDYTLAQEEHLGAKIATQGDTTVNLENEIFNRPIPALYATNGFTRKVNATKITQRNGGVYENIVADNASVTLDGQHRYIINVYFDRNHYTYSYKYVDHKQEKLYNDKVKNGESVVGVWDGVIQTFSNQGPENVEKEVTINAAQDVTYNGIPYTRVSNKDVTVTIAPITQQNPTVNEVKVYYKKFTERELTFKLACANEDSPYTEVDYSDPETKKDPLYGGLSNPMQTIEHYNDIQDVIFYNFNDAKVTDTGGTESYVHPHKYNFLGWFDNPEGTGTPLTTNATLTKADMNLNEDIPARDTTYYAVVEQVLVRANFEFRYVDTDITQLDDTEATALVAAAPIDANGDYSGGYFDFSAPSTYQNNTPIPWHRTDGYSMSIEPKDNRVYKYEFAEWWEEDFNEEPDAQGNYPLVRKHNWNSSGEWSPTTLDDQVTRNGNKHIIAVYKRRTVTSLPYTIKYRFDTRNNGTQDYVVKGTLTGDELTEGNANVKINNAGAYELTDEFILNNAPYESNHGQTLTWSNGKDDKGNDLIYKTSYTGDGSTTQDRIETIVTAKQGAQKVAAHYRLTDSGTYTTIRTTVGSNRGMDSRLEALNLTGNDNFLYWAIRQTENGPVIAKCYDPWFTYRIFSNYWISPVFSNTAKLNPSAIAQNNEDWLAWTWNTGESGTLVFPSADLTFTGLKDKVKFIRVPKGTTTLEENWSNIWNETGDLDVQDGHIFRLTHFGEYGTAMYGEWGDSITESNINIARIDYSRNRWTDSEGNVAADGSTDLLFSDYEIAFNNYDDKALQSSDYTIGIVFEMCETLGSGSAFAPDECSYQSDFNAIGNAVKSLKNKNVSNYNGSYKYNGTDTRKIQINRVANSDLTNKNRLEVAKYYKNKNTYVNRDAIMKVTAYLIDKDGEVTFSNSVYACLNSVGTKDLAKDNDSDGSSENTDTVNVPDETPYISED